MFGDVDQEVSVQHTTKVMMSLKFDSDVACERSEAIGDDKNDLVVTGFGYGADTWNRGWRAATVVTY